MNIKTIDIYIFSYEETKHTEETPEVNEVKQEVETPWKLHSQEATQNKWQLRLWTTWKCWHKNVQNWMIRIYA